MQRVAPALIARLNPFEVREPIQTLRAEKFNADKHLRGGLQKKSRRGKLMVGKGVFGLNRPAQCSASFRSPMTTAPAG